MTLRSFIVIRDLGFHLNGVLVLGFHLSGPLVLWKVPWSCPGSAESLDLDFGDAVGVMEATFRAPEIP